MYLDGTNLAYGPMWFFLVIIAVGAFMITRSARAGWNELYWLTNSPKKKEPRKEKHYALWLLIVSLLLVWTGMTGYLGLTNLNPTSPYPELLMLGALLLGFVPAAVNFVRRLRLSISLKPRAG